MKYIVLCSGKGGTGKSCVAAYTGSALAKAGQKTLLIELGADYRALDIICGTLEEAAFGAEDVFAGRCSAKEAVTAVPNAQNLFLLAAGIKATGSPPPMSKQVEQLIREAGRGYDYVIVDAANLNTFPIELADLFVLVLTPDTLCVRACAQTSRELYRAGARQVRLLINNVPPRIIPIDGAEDFDDIIDQVGAQLLGVIPASPKLQYCANNSQQLDPDSLTVKIFDHLAGRLMGQRRPLLIR